MAAVLKEAGFETEIIDLFDEKKKILELLEKLNPLIIGFSVIYQYHIDQFAGLIRFLREAGIICHFTAGGHYASLKYTELFTLIPLIDSVVRFEGEYPMCELVKRIYSGQEWRNIRSIAYVNNGDIVCNPLLALEEDLDRLPYPIRTKLPEYVFDKKFATILAGRGCVYNCSFCNLKAFYLPFKGMLKRLRKPEMVVKEMQYLFREKDCSVFLFQDDDFPVRNKNGYGWIIRFCEELRSKGLSDKIMWKINCRPDEIEEECFSLMKNNGLFLVFIGIEDGTDSGLKKINKNMTTEECRNGIETLKKLEIGFDFGFMLFQPDTTFRSLNNNLDYLRSICGDCFTSVPFLKMMPYYETRIEKELIAEGRIKGKPGNWDYDFLEDSMNHYFEFLTKCFFEWTCNRNGVGNISKWARNYVSVCYRYYGSLPFLYEISYDLKKTISESNLYLLDTMKKLAIIFESGNYDKVRDSYLKSIKKDVLGKHEFYKKKINNSMTKISLLVELLQNTKRHFIDIDLVKTTITE